MAGYQRGLKEMTSGNLPKDTCVHPYRERRGAAGFLFQPDGSISCPLTRRNIGREYPCQGCCFDWYARAGDVEMGRGEVKKVETLEKVEQALVVMFTAQSRSDPEADAAQWMPVFRAALEK